MREGEIMDNVKEGNKISILFEAKLESGETVLKTEDEKPLEITVGQGTIPVSIEKALVDMKVGESKTIKLEPIEAFGPKIDNLVIDLPKDGFNQEADLTVGSKVTIKSPDGRNFMGTIIEIKEDCITVDFNHPLAGRSLEFTVTIVSIL